VADPGRIAGPIVIPNTIQIRLLWTLATNKQVFNVLHGQVASGFAVTAAAAEAIYTDIVGTAAWTAFRAHLNAGVSFTGVDLRDLRSANQPLVASTAAAQAGTGAGTALPPGDSLVVTLRTAGAGRSFRGRVYLPGFDTSALAAGGVASAATVTDATAFVNAIQTQLTGQGITLAIAQPARQAYTGRTGASHPARAAAIAPVTSIVTRNNIFDHQRRRAGRS
jgi:hypothetical protein